MLKLKLLTINELKQQMLKLAKAQYVEAKIYKDKCVESLN